MPYYHLVSSLPRPRSDQRDAEIDLKNIQAHIRENLTTEDDRLFCYLLYRNDNQNLLNILARLDGLWDPESQTFHEPAAFTHQQLEEGLHGSFDLPDYMQEFLTAYHAGQLPTDRRPRANLLKDLYYRESLQQPHSFLANYFGFKRDLKNIVAALNARKFKRPVHEVLVGDYDLTEMIRQSNEKDFGLSREYAFVPDLEDLLANGEAGQLEEYIDRLLWDFMNEHLAHEYFSSARVFSYFIKLSLGHRWLPLEQKAGKDRLEELIQHVLSRASWPQELSA